MRTLLLAVLGALTLAPAVWAAPKGGEWGAGLLLGDPTAGTVKYFLDPDQALDAGIGVSDNFTLIADYSYQFWDVLAQPKKGDLAAYASVGGRLETERYNNLLLRPMLGLGYWPRFKKNEFEFFLELGPGYRIAPDNHWRLEGGFGLRAYLWNAGAKKN